MKLSEKYKVGGKVEILSGVPEYLQGSFNVFGIYTIVAVERDDYPYELPILISNEDGEQFWPRESTFIVVEEATNAQELTSLRQRLLNNLKEIKENQDKIISLQQEIRSILGGVFE